MQVDGLPPAPEGDLEVDPTVEHLRREYLQARAVVQEKPSRGASSSQMSLIRLSRPPSQRTPLRCRGWPSG
ncbi:MAG: hypothetical protein WKF73_09295 [Nocardioidaceae bacterium]